MPLIAAMVLLIPLGIGALARLLYACFRGAPLTPPHINKSWLVPAAFLPQWLIFYLPANRGRVPEAIAAATLVLSMAALLVFVAANRKIPALLVLGVGLALNLAVITLNGGWMPISPETLGRLLPGVPSSAWELGARLGTGKDIVLPAGETLLWELSDRFLLPAWAPYQVAFSLGDVLIACGGLLLPWVKSTAQRKEKG